MQSLQFRSIVGFDRCSILESAAGLKTSLDTAMAGQYELKSQMEQLQSTVRSRDKQIESLTNAKREVGVHLLIKKLISLDQNTIHA